MMVIEDHTTPVDTSAALQAAGLTDRAWTLDPTAAIPTLGQLVDAGRNLVIFAENAGPGSPDWYQSAYEWFQETPYTWKSIDDMSCAPNRGKPGNPFMLINHWVAYSPPDPGKVGSLVNAEDELSKRIDECIDQRGVLPNVVAVDFAERGDLVSFVKSFNEDTRETLGALSGSSDDEATDTTAPDTSTTLPPDDVGSTSSAFQTATQITSLTGGNPEAFCSAVDPVLDVMTGWALADLAKPAQAGGLPALTYGPLADRLIQQILPVAPVELAQQLGAAADQSAAAVEALRQAGLDQSAIDALADALSDQLGGPNPDSAVAERLIVDRLQTQLGRDATLALAKSFDVAHPTAGAVFDLGEVSTEAAAGSGYDCLG
jgi:hypothetical protein